MQKNFTYGQYTVVKSYFCKPFSYSNHQVTKKKEHCHESVWSHNVTTSTKSVITSTERSSSVKASRTLLQKGHASVDKIKFKTFNNEKVSSPLVSFLLSKQWKEKKKLKDKINIGNRMNHMELEL